MSQQTSEQDETCLEIEIKQYSHTILNTKSLAYNAFHAPHNIYPKQYLQKKSWIDDTTLACNMRLNVSLITDTHTGTSTLTVSGTQTPTQS